MKYSRFAHLGDSCRRKVMDSICCVNNWVTKCLNSCRHGLMLSSVAQLRMWKRCIEYFQRWEKKMAEWPPSGVTSADPTGVGRIEHETPLYWHLTKISKWRKVKKRKGESQVKDKTVESCVRWSKCIRRVLKGSVMLSLHKKCHCILDILCISL